MNPCKKFNRKSTASPPRRFCTEVARNHISVLCATHLIQMILLSGFHNRGEAEFWISGSSAPQPDAVGRVKPEPSTDASSAASPSKYDVSTASISGAYKTSPNRHSKSEVTTSPLGATLSNMRRIMDATGELTATPMALHRRASAIHCIPIS
jgi:hypothetical protein